MGTRPVVNFITGNANKLREVKAILEPAITVTSQTIEIEEVQGTVEEVTRAKCRKAAEMVSARDVSSNFCFAKGCTDQWPRPCGGHVPLLRGTW